MRRLLTPSFFAAAKKEAKKPLRPRLAGRFAGKPLHRPNRSGSATRELSTRRQNINSCSRVPIALKK